MKTLVVYDSVFGNTEKIAVAIAQTLGAEAIRVSAIRPEHWQGVQLLLVGSPTRGFSATPALMEWLKALPAGAHHGVRAAAFDTRIDANTIGFFLFRWLVANNYAVKPIQSALTLKGADIAGQAGGFFVKDREGPLEAGELERAAAWAKSL